MVIQSHYRPHSWSLGLRTSYHVCISTGSAPPHLTSYFFCLCIVSWFNSILGLIFIVQGYAEMYKENAECDSHILEFLTLSQPLHRSVEFCLSNYNCGSRTRGASLPGNMSPLVDGQRKKPGCDSHPVTAVGSKHIQYYTHGLGGFCNHLHAA